MKKNNFYKELPEGYVPVHTVDAIGNKKFAVLINVIGLLLMIAVGLPAFLLKFPSVSTIKEVIMDDLDTSFWQTELLLLGFIFVMSLYLVLHELVHGAAYKMLTREKLTFGISLSCAFCGVPNVYVTRRTALISLLAPFTVFSVLFLSLVVFLNGLLALMAVVMFALHVGGCVGDLYDTMLLLFRYRGDVLMNDNGPRQVFYQKQ